MTSQKYDYIIVGGGSAGSALANRLSENPNKSVLVLEAGRMDSWWDVYIHMPAALTFPIGNKHYDWMYSSEPEPHMNNRRVSAGRGKVIGGSSSINGMIFQRGNPMDYEKWAQEPGMSNWDYAHCLPYFKKMETAKGRDSEWRGTSGPLEVNKGRVKNPLFSAFFSAAQEAGYPLTEDVNGYQQEGFAPFDGSVRNGRRLSAAGAYLHPVLHRKNLTVKTRTLVTKIRFDAKKAVGVDVLVKGKKKASYDCTEVILCGGAINSPQLLQLSGVGDGDHLSSVGVETVHHLPGVGENLQDHLEVYVQHSCKQPVSLNPNLAFWRRPFIGAAWLFLRKGPGASNHFEGGGFARSNEDVGYPNLMFHFLPIAVRYDGTAPEGGHGYQVHVGPMYSNARGSVKITSNQATDAPAIQFNYLSTDQDKREWVEAIQVARTIMNQPAFEPYSAGEISPGSGVSTAEEILEWVRRDGETAYHPSCTCKMGIDDMSVVDPDSFKVHGVEGVRVVDASVMPVVTNANIYAPTMMIAEKAADLIKGNNLLPSEDITFYQHRKSQ
jgi:choline dehydrogenase